MHRSRPGHCVPILSCPGITLPVPGGAWQIPSWFETLTRITATDPLSWLDDELASLDDASLRRRLADVRRIDGARVVLDGRELVQFSSNDYLDLAGDRRLAEAARKAAERHGWGAGASALISGHSEAHRRLETALAEFEGTEAALVFGSGYAANVGALTALAGRGDAVFSDELNHASLIDGCRLSRADVRVYSHGNVSRLAAMLAETGDARRRLIVTDTLFSMDGDVAPLADLADLAERCDAILVVDEAHATGVFGPRGRGACEQFDIESRVSVRIGTLSKALGGVGGFVAGSRRLINWLVNRARPYVFSTALPPAACEAALAALEIVATEPQRRRQLLDRAAELRHWLAEQGWQIGNSTSHIIPLVVGSASRAIELSEALRQRGLWVPAIREPSVPPGTSRLRISLSYAHTPEMILRLVSALGELRSTVA